MLNITSNIVNAINYSCDVTIGIANASFLRLVHLVLDYACNYEPEQHGIEIFGRFLQVNR